MIEIITEEVKMPDDVYSCRFQKKCKNNTFSVIDTETNTTVYKGKWEDVALSCYNLNKKHYRENKI